MRTRTTLALALGAVALATGCGGAKDPNAGGGASRPAGAPPTNVNSEKARSAGPHGDARRDAALACIHGRGVHAVAVADDGIQVDTPATGPRIRFFTNSGEAEGLQFQGDAEGAEQIGAALLYTRGASDHELAKLEACLMDQA